MLFRVCCLGEWFVRLCDKHILIIEGVEITDEFDF